MRHNQVLLCGVVQNAPKVRKTKDAQYGELTVVTITGRRSGGLQLNSGEYDTPIIVATDADRVDEIEKVKIGDLVLVKGALATRMVYKTPLCPHCGQRQRLEGQLTYITPISVSVIKKGVCLNQYNNFDAKLAVATLRELKEVSNYATILGVVAIPPKAYKSEGEKKRRIVSYQMATKRKFRILGSAADDKVDFPWVKSYGKVGINDARYIKKGTYIFVDGWIRARTFSRTDTCQHCGKDFDWKDMSQEIVSYATEYLKNYNEVATSEEEIRKEVQEIRASRTVIINESEIEDKKQSNKEDRDDAVEELKTLDAYLREVEEEDDDVKETDD